MCACTYMYIYTVTVHICFCYSLQDPSEVKSNSPDPLPLANSNVAVVNPNYFQDVEEGKVSLSPENSSLETTSVTSSKAVTPCPSTPNLDNGTLSTMPPSEPITKDEFQDHLNNLDANEQEGFENELKVKSIFPLPDASIYRHLDMSVHVHVHVYYASNTTC